MATVRARPKIPPEKIEKFLGLNESTDGETSLLIGESPNMVNFRVTEQYKIGKREGYELVVDTGKTTSAVNGMWHGKLANTETFLVACGGDLYKYNLTASTLTTVSTLIANNTVSFFSFDSNVYVLDGTEYFSYNGTTFSTVSGYVPKIAISTPPTGGGTDFEQINVLTGKKHQTFNASSTASEYHLAEVLISSLDDVKYSGTSIATGSYSVNTTSGVVTITTASISGWTAGEDNLDIYWTKGTGSRDQVTDNNYAVLYGGENDTRVHIWGNPNIKNQVVFSDLADGVPSAEYFPAFNFSVVGSDEFAVTDVVKQYGRRLIFTERDAWYSYYNADTDYLGNKLISFPTFPLNQVKGNLAMAQTRVLNNNPVTIFNGVHEWVNTQVNDERNAVYISKRSQPSMDEVDLRTAITYDWEDKFEYWLCVGSTVWVYNYRLDVWYKFDNIAAKCFLVIAGELYFGTADGKVYKFNEEKRSDAGTAITAEWEMGFTGFQAEYLRKYINAMWLSLNPEANSSVELVYRTDRPANDSTYTAEYKLSTFESMNFADFSFNTNYNPQIFRFKIKAKKFGYFKVILTNDSDSETATVLALILKTRYGGEIK